MKDYKKIKYKITYLENKISDLKLKIKIYPSYSIVKNTLKFKLYELTTELNKYKELESKLNRIEKLKNILK